MLKPLTVADVHSWVDAAHTRWAADLQFRELRRGVQAVSNLYVHKRNTRALSDKAADGRGKRAAFVVYYGGLHLVLTQEWMREHPAERVDTVFDFGCGPGVVGAAAGRWTGCGRVEASDRLGRHLEVAAWTGRQLGVRTKTRKASLPQAVERTRGPGLLTFGWVLNELSDDDRRDTLTAVVRRLQAGAGALIFAPLSLRASPWWPEAVRTIRQVRPDCLDQEYRCQPDLPQLLSDLDRAARLDHRTLGARVLYARPTLTARPATE